MTSVLAQHSFGTGPENIVAVDLNAPARLDDVARATPGTTLQYPVSNGVRIGWYRLPAGGNVNLTPEKAVFVVDEVGDVRLPVKSWTDGLTFGCRWGANGHATFTPSGTILHAARQDGAFFGIIPVSTWGTLETDLFGKVIGKLTKGRTEPHYSGTRLAFTTTDGVVTPTRTFKPLTGQPFDPIISPDGSKVVWLECLALFPARWQLVVGDVSTGQRTVVVAARDWWQTTHAHWLDDSTLICSQMDPTASVKHWALIAVDASIGDVTVLTGAEHGSFLCPVVA